MENKSYIIYKFTNKLNGKIYIGVTKRSLNIRLHEHITASNEPKFKFHQALKKYGIDNFNYEIIMKDVKTKDDANKFEIYYIDLFDSYKNGYNMTQGGGNRSEFRHTDESKLKLRESHLGKKLSKSQKENISKSLMGVPKSETHRINVIKSITGLKRNETVKQLLSKLKIGKQIADKNPSAIKVNIYDADGVLRFICNGNFETICKINNLPIIALRKSYYNNGKQIYQGHTIKKEVLIKNKQFIGWYAVKL
jgi:group I intron endonuclease